jgi:D-threo-aldose 1-dehydrogenase
MAQPIPAALWRTLREQGLIAADAPVPGENR